MNNIQKKINKLITAFLYVYKVIIKVQVEERYSLSKNRIFRVYKIVENTEEELLLKQEYYKLLNQYKSKGRPSHMKKELTRYEQKIKELKKPMVEFFKKIDVLVYLVKRYKHYQELIKDEK